MLIWIPIIPSLLDSKHFYSSGLLSDPSLNSSQGLGRTLHRLGIAQREWTFIESLLSANQPERCHLILLKPYVVGNTIISILRVWGLRLQENGLVCAQTRHSHPGSATSELVMESVPHTGYDYVFPPSTTRSFKESGRLFMHPFRWALRKAAL